MTVQQHLKRFYKLSLLLLVAGICLPAVAQSQQYATKRLAHIDALLQKATFRHALNCRKNSFQEVEHLGLLLFPQQIRNLKPSPVYDFLERYLLELNIAKEEERERLLMQYSVTFVTGTPATALTVDTTFTYTEHELLYGIVGTEWEGGAANHLSEKLATAEWMCHAGTGRQHGEKTPTAHRATPTTTSCRRQVDGHPFAEQQTLRFFLYSFKKGQEKR